MTSYPLLSVRRLWKVYERRSSIRSTSERVEALAEIDLDVLPGEALALIGRSGSGKTTLAYCLAGHAEPTAGEIHFNGQRVWPGPLRPIPGVQLLFQDSPAALNPHWTGIQSLEEPLRIRGFSDGTARVARAKELAARVGLPRACLQRKPDAMSGGQRQRLAIARALAMEPIRLLILDEPLRGLDTAAKDRLLKLFENLQSRSGLAMIYISHDLATVRRVASRVIVLDRGRIVEAGAVQALLMAPQHPATRDLVRAILPCPS